MDDRACLNGILFVLATGIGWERLPQQLGYGSGMTCCAGCGTGRPLACGTGCTRCCWLSCAPPAGSS
jgi:transposase